MDSIPNWANPEPAFAPVGPIDVWLQTIADIIKLLEALEYKARIRVLNYIGQRLNSDF